MANQNHISSATWVNELPLLIAEQSIRAQACQLPCGIWAASPIRGCGVPTPDGHRVPRTAGSPSDAGVSNADPKVARPFLEIGPAVFPAHRRQTSPQLLRKLLLP